MCGRLYSCDALLERLAQDLEDLVAALGQFVQARHAVVGQRHLARPRPVALADQPDSGDGVMGGRETAGPDQGRPVAGVAGDAVEARSLDGFGQRHRRQNGAEAPRQHRHVCTQQAEPNRSGAEYLGLFPRCHRFAQRAMVLTALSSFPMLCKAPLRSHPAAIDMYRKR